jgi:hypothetical protein
MRRRKVRAPRARDRQHELGQPALHGERWAQRVAGVAVVEQKLRAGQRSRQAGAPDLAVAAQLCHALHELLRAPGGAHLDEHAAGSLALG